MNLDTKSWKAFRFGDLISEIYKAQAYKDEDLSFSKKLTEDSIPYVTRTDLNNGVKAFALRERLENIEKGNALVIGDTTATISYQKDDFIAGDHIVIVRTNWLNEYTGLFVMTLLKKESYRYSYGRAFKIDIIKETALKLPTKKDGSPDWQFMESFIKSLRHKPLSTKAGGKTPKLDVSSWKSYRLGDLFAFQKGKRLTKSDMVPGNVNFLGAIDGNNGVREK
ncbi:MAG: restriction endonuclease subunit S [Treponema sp.]|nr:restriction endonuclease subunit S [Treponema sp.]